MKLHPYVQRGLIALVVLLLSVSVARLLVTMHQQEERISILESQVEALLSDTSRLQIPASPQRYYSSAPARHYTPHRNAGSNSSRAYVYNRYKPEASSSDSIPQASSSAFTHGVSQSEASRKFTEPHLFDLNTVDSLTLIRIPGIAARTASVILKHRQSYGGFYDANQLRDFLTWDAALDYLDEWCTLWFTANADRLIRISLNTATVSQLQRHPYISHEQAVEIMQFRIRHKGFHQASELQQLSTFTPEEITKLLPYLSFES